MKHIGKIAGLALSTVAALSMTVPAFASDYSFTTTAPRDYYGSTSYEDVYGAKYNYGGKSVVDYQALELEFGQPSTTMTGVMERVILPGLQDTVATGGGGTGGYGTGGGGGPITQLVEGTGGPNTISTPSIPGIPVSVSVLTDPAAMVRSDGSIGTLKIPKLGISVKVWRGETNASMAKGLGHYNSTSGWDGNCGVCGHNRGARYNIGTIKNLSAGDLITYTTVYGTRTYAVTMVKVIANNDWSYLQATADNRITITTCLENHPESRVCVQAVEVK